MTQSANTKDLLNFSIVQLSSSLYHQVTMAATKYLNLFV